MELQQRICNERNTKEKISCPYLHVSAQFYQDENIELHQWYNRKVYVLCLLWNDPVVKPADKV